MTTGPDDEDAAAYFDALAGRTPGGPGAAALREALLAQQRTLDEAEQATPAALSAQEHERMAAIRRRLLEAGAWHAGAAAPPAGASAGRAGEPARAHAASASPHRGDAGPWAAFLQRLRSLVPGDSWQRPMAYAASFALAAVLILRLGYDAGDDPSQVLRGPPGHTVTVPDAGARAAALEAELLSAGAEVLRVQVAQRQWALSVSVPEAGRVAAVRQVLGTAGFRLDGPPPWELNLRGPP